MAVAQELCDPKVQSALFKTVQAYIAAAGQFMVNFSSATKYQLEVHDIPEL